PDGADDGLCGRVLELPQARVPAGRALQRLRRADPGSRGGAQARRRPGGPAHRHRSRAPARVRLAVPVPALEFQPPPVRLVLQSRRVTAAAGVPSTPAATSVVSVAWGA